MNNKKLKIVMLLSRIDQSGLTKHTIDLAKGLTDLGHQILLITGGISEDEKSERVFAFYNMFETMGVEVKTFKKPSGSIIKKGFKGVLDLIRMLICIKKYNPNVIHSQSPYMTFIPWLMGKKFTTTIHQMGLKRNIFYKNPTHIIAISEESKQDSIDNYGIREDEVTIVHHGIPDEYAQTISEGEKLNLKNEHNIPHDKLILGSASILSKRKGIDLIVKALEALSCKAKSKIYFIFLGDDVDSERTKKLHKMIETANIESITTHIPFQNPKPFYDIMDVFVLPSRQESFPLVALEAMMSGCCPIRSNTEGSYEQINHGTNGLLFQNKDILGLRDAFEKVILDDDLRQTFQKNAKKDALERFTIPRMTKNTLEIYEKIRIH
ncbi:glycosyltransferase involved in cell wall biosynthesis [Maribacter caenipelagi]|uniref:Glycosyltransferase involved in cell wall biosynthesis n=1 Tax=Maribacter caenipelagi TaxID=1447781 RepID=A0A4V3E1I5_9FLAO|nr:glycosyltransferase family 4 protein [Maribacter caenipelagi]TDS13428.1 glycosyltransferase involved in cell wall biosynthesis [Maribacter caenipelagi]